VATKNEPKAVVRVREPVQKRARETRQRIVEAARAVIAEHGFDAATTTMIAERAHTSIGSVYAHFPDKIEIFLEILAAQSEAVYRYSEQQMGDIIAGGEAFESALQHLIPGLYRAHRLVGKLNYELTRFVLMNERAEQIDAEWEAREDELIIRFLEHYRDRVRIEDRKSAAVIIHRSLHEVFQYLFQHRDRVDERSVLGELVRMLEGYIIR
jgi:AcrR family transcriptional regulator